MHSGLEEKTLLRVIQVKISKSEKLSNNGYSGNCADSSRSKKPGQARNYGG